MKNIRPDHGWTLKNPLDAAERIKMYLVAGGLTLCLLLNWLLP